jgi:hypothetical protein
MSMTSKKLMSKKLKETKKKYNWIIASGDTITGIEYADIIKNKTKEELGAHIRENIDELYDHFTSIVDREYGGQIFNMMKKLQKVYGRDFFSDFDTEKDFNTIINTLKNKLEKFTNTEIVDEFAGNDGSREAYFVRISHLERKMNCLVKHDFIDSNNSSESD